MYSTGSSYAMQSDAGPSTAGSMEYFLSRGACSQTSRNTARTEHTQPRPHGTPSTYWQEPYHGEDLLGKTWNDHGVGRTIYDTRSEQAGTLAGGKISQDADLRFSQKSPYYRQRTEVDSHSYRARQRLGGVEEGFMSDMSSPDPEEAISPPKQTANPEYYDCTRTDVFNPVLYQRLVEIAALRDAEDVKTEERLVAQFFREFVDETVCAASPPRGIC